MAGIISSRMDATCNMHNALRNISGYACGVNAPLQRIPGNTGCEIQFCDVEPVTSSYTSRIHYGRFTDDIADEISKVGYWGIASFNDDGLPSADQESAVLARPAPPGWTSAAAKSGDAVSSSSTPISTPDPTSSPTSSPGSSHTPSAGPGSSYHTGHSHTGLKAWAVTALIAMGFVIAL
ncbi:hypothetical protein F5Y19DRAFT_479472 [Xylariaceae sp. FL1651]|nr:hypothetical protein F5Y19DRAFT_479472 [Xylariaceae sp. FL1651]